MTCRALIVDDEVVAREAVRMLLADVPRITVVGEAANARDAAQLIRDLRPDLVFLDIQMPGEDGLRMLQGLGGDVPRGIVFVTAFDGHAARAFEHHALDYVVKPFGRPRFHAAVTRALERLDGMDALSLVRTLQHVDLAGAARPHEGSLVPAALRAAASTAPERLGVRIGNRVRVLEVAAIDWIEACDDYTRVHAGSVSCLASERLQDLEQRLTPKFVRIHRSLLVNASRIRELHRESDGGGSLRLADGVRLRVARNRWDHLIQVLSLHSV